MQTEWTEGKPQTLCNRCQAVVQLSAGVTYSSTRSKFCGAGYGQSVFLNLAPAGSLGSSLTNLKFSTNAVAGTVCV